MSPTISQSKKSAAKSTGRQTNNSLSSIAGHVVIESSGKSNDNSKQSASSGKTNEPAAAAKKSSKVSNAASNNKNNNNAKTTEKKGARNSTATAAAAVVVTPQKASSSSVLTETEEVLQIGLHKVLEHVKNHKDAWPFMDPVEEDIAPRYYSIIRRPMDLQQMDERLENGQYQTFTDFRNDFKLIVNNCRLYNGQNNEYTEMVNNLQHAFEKATKKYFDQNSSDEDADLEYPDQKTNVFREKNNSAKNSITPKIKEIIGTKGLPLKSGGRKATAAAATAPAASEATEKPVEKRGRKRKQKFKDKRKSDTKRTAAAAAHSEDEESELDDDLLSGAEENAAAAAVAAVEEKDEEEGEEEEEEEEIVPAKKAKKEKVKESKAKGKKSLNKKASKETSKEAPKSAVTRRRSARKEEALSEPEEIVELKPPTKKKKAKAEPVKVEPPVVAVTPPASEKSKAKSGNDNNSKTKKEKSTKKRKSSDAVVIAAAHLSDADETMVDQSPPKKEKNAKEKKVDKKADKKGNKKNAVQKAPKQSDVKAEKKVANKKKTKVTRSGKQKEAIAATAAATTEEPVRSRTPSVSSNTSSMSNSPTRFTVDLHEKYSKSASNTNINKIDHVESKKNSRARSPSPSLSLYSSENSNSVKDKFDLIKERRSRSSNNDDKWKQIVKNAEKIKDKTSATTSTSDGAKVPEKNQKLKETIEKLKQKNKQSKKLLNKLSDAKSSSSGVNNKAEEKSTFDLLKESKPIKAKDKSKEIEHDTAAQTSIDGTNKKSPNKKSKEKAIKGHKKSGKHSNKSTNMEALELETEQTLKDINRWLEHTPRFPEFNSASNSPTRFNNLLYDFDTVTSKLDPADFRRPLPITNDSTSSATATFTSATENNVKNNNATTSAVATTTPPTKQSSSSIDDSALTAKENKPAPKQTIQLIGIPPPPGPHKRDKEPKRKSLKEKISAMIPKRKEIHRTIERLQPGKAKGNLIGAIHSGTKPEDVSVLGTSNANKLKDSKNSLVQETDDSGPKLSLGTVLNTAGFGLIQQHNFADNENTKDDDLLCDSVSKDACSDDMELEEIVTSTEQLAREKERKEKEEKEQAEKKSKSPGDKSATPNLNAWLKAFGVPKKQKKSDDDDAKKSDKSSKDLSQNSNSHFSSSSTSVSNEQNSIVPATRATRKASTGSTISERSSYSQDPDSPRIGIDERICGSYPAPYPSPLGASPVMTSPKDDTQTTKPASPYSAAMNGSIRVGFYQDTTTKSSPEKSCSPREQPSASPYSNYAQHLYVSTTTSGTSSSYSTGLSYTSPVKATQNTAAPLGFNKKTPSYYDQYKQPKSQDESDYNSSVGSNPTSPYQSQHSPYQSENSPYQSQTSPYAQQPNSIQSNVSSPYQNQHSPYQDTSMQQQHSPYSQNSSSGSAQDLHTQQQQQQQHIASMPKTSPQAANQSVSSQQQHLATSMSAVSPTQQQLSPLENKSANANAIPYGLQSYSSHYANLADPPAPTVINSSSTLHDKPKQQDDEQRDILNLDYAKVTSANNKTTNQLNNKPTDLSHMNSLNKSQQQQQQQQQQQHPQQQQQSQHSYEHSSMFEPMGFNKNYDISSTKAIEMFNRAATMSFSKSFPTPLSVAGKTDNTVPNSGLLNAYQPPSMHSNYSLYSLDSKSATTHLGYSPHDTDSQITQSQSLHQTDKHVTDLSGATTTPRHTLYGNERLDAIPSTASGSIIPNDNRMKSSELNVPSIPPSHRYDVPTYDPNMRIHHPGLVDDNLNGNCYYPPKDPNVTAQGLYGKNVLPPSSSQLPSSQPSSISHNLNPYKLATQPAPQLSPQSQPQPPAPEPAKPKRTRRKKNVVETAVAAPVPPVVQSIPSQVPPTQSPSLVNNHPQMMQQHNLSWNPLDPSVNHSNAANQVPSSVPQTQAHQSILNQQHPQHPLQATPSQGFQSYAGLKPGQTLKNSPTPEAPISLKTNSIVPGSAFNFGPTTSGSLALGGIYGENTPYLDEYRTPTNPYYLPPQTHRTTVAPPEQNAENTGVPSAAGSPASYVTASRGATSPAPTYHQFIPHHPYTNSQIYQQYLRTEEYRQRVMFANQGLLPHSAPTGYPQPSAYHHPALGMHKPYGW